MKMKLLLLTGFAGFLLSAADALAQPGGAGNPRSAQDARGGPPGGSRGGFFGTDPNERFNQLTGGKDVWSRAEIQDPWMQRMFDRLADQIGVKNGQITRQQYLDYQEQRAAQRGGRRSQNPPADAARNSAAPGPAPGGGGFRGRRGNRDSTPEGMFARLDQNGDGYINYDEMPEELRIERQKWDSDRNGLIDLSEFRAFYAARVAPALAGSGAASQGAADWQSYSYDSAPPEEERKPPVVYRPGKLPKELPSWFTQLDTDHDGQVALYEWKASSRPLQEFDELDRNKDGFLTVDEVLRSLNKGKENGEQSPGAPENYAVNPYDFRGPFGFRSNRFWGRGGGGPPFGGRDRGGPDFGPRGGGRGGRNRGGGENY